MVITSNQVLLLTVLLKKPPPGQVWTARMISNVASLPDPGNGQRDVIGLASLGVLTEVRLTRAQAEQLRDGPTGRPPVTAYELRPQGRRLAVNLLHEAMRE